MPKSELGHKVAEIQAITAALNRIDDLPALGRSVLASLPAVTQRLQRDGLDDTPFQRGRVLGDLLHGLVAHHARFAASNRDTTEWTILYRRVNDMQMIDEIARDLGMPRRSVDRYYQRAKALLLDALYKVDVDQRRPGLFCPVCATRLAGAVPSSPTTSACTGCGATITVTKSDGTIDVRVQVVK